MTYSIKTVFPKQEGIEDKKLIERTEIEYLDDIETGDVIKYYGNLLTKGYSVSASFTPPTDGGEEQEQDAFAIAHKLELAGIQYRATLRLKATGLYEDMVKIARLIEQQDYDYDFVGDFKVRENSSIDMERQSSWFDSEFAKFTVKPKAASADIMDLKTLYDSLVEEHQKVEIAIRAKVKKDDDDSFATQLASYPDGTLVAFKLKDADIYGE